MIEDANACIDWTHSKENQGPWLKKTTVSLWSIPGTRKKAENIDTPEETFGEGPSFTGQLQLPKESRGDSSQDGDNPDHDVRPDWCLGKQGSCGQVCPGRRRRS